MVKALRSEFRASDTELSHCDEMEEEPLVRDDYFTRHEQLVAYIHAVSGQAEAFMSLLAEAVFNGRLTQFRPLETCFFVLISQERRSGVWNEHSYARGRERSRGAVRTLLQAPLPQATSPEAFVDVESVTEVPVPPPDSEDDTDDEVNEEGDNLEWESRVVSQAPSARHAALCARAAALLRDDELARAARVPRAKPTVKTLAEKLRIILGPGWSWGGSTWCILTLQAYLPGAIRARLSRAISRLARLVPGLARRLHVAPDITRRIREPQAPPSQSPWLVFLQPDSSPLQQTWRRAFSPHLHTRHIVAAINSGAMSPPAHCAAVAAVLKQGLGDLRAEYPDQAMIICGVAGGATLCTCLLQAGGAGGGAGAALAGALLIAPYVHTAVEIDMPRSLGIPSLTVCGGGVAAAGARGRVLAVRGVDRWLRSTTHCRDDAVRAAIVDECVRWAKDVMESDGRAMEMDIDVTSTGQACEEYAHLPAITTETHKMPRIEVTAGRVSLPPPRLSAPPDAGLGAADILQMPIVFADDTPQHAALPEAAAGSDASPLTVTSGTPRSGGSAVKFTRVIVAKRPARGSVTSGGQGTPGRQAGGRGRGAPRPVLVHRGLTLVHKK